MNKAEFLFKYSPYAKASAVLFGFSDYFFLLAQQYAENSGSSSLLSKTNNVGSLVARNASGKKLKTNEFWNGEDYLAKSSGLYFRVYTDLQNGYHDYARLLARVYKLNAAKTIEQYAAQVSSSKYISEDNGDDRELYRTNIINTYKLLTR